MKSFSSSPTTTIRFFCKSIFSHFLAVRKKKRIKLRTITTANFPVIRLIQNLWWNSCSNCFLHFYNYCRFNSFSSLSLQCLSDLRWKCFFVPPLRLFQHSIRRRKSGKFLGADKLVENSFAKIGFSLAPHRSNYHNMLSYHSPLAYLLRSVHKITTFSVQCLFGTRILRCLASEDTLSEASNYPSRAIL